MAWLESASVEIVRRLNYRWKYHYAIATAKSEDPSNPGFFDLFDKDDATVVDPAISVDDEVIRRIRINIVDRSWPGVAKGSPVLDKVNALRNDPEYGSVTADWNGAGGYDISAQQYLVDPAGWSKWIRIQDLDTYEAGGGAIE